MPRCQEAQASSSHPLQNNLRPGGFLQYLLSRRRVGDCSCWGAQMVECGLCWNFNTWASWSDWWGLHFVSTCESLKQYNTCWGDIRLHISQMWQTEAQLIVYTVHTGFPSSTYQIHHRQLQGKIGWVPMLVRGKESWSSGWSSGSPG